MLAKDGNVTTEVLARICQELRVQLPNIRRTTKKKDAYNG